MNSGGTVYLLLPEDVTEWPESDRALLQGPLPGIFMGRDAEWASSRATGAYDWMLAGQASPLWIAFSDEYEEDVERDGWAGDVAQLPRPDCLLSWLPPEVPLCMGSGPLSRVAGLYPCIGGQ